MSLSGLITKHKKEGFPKIPVSEQIQMCRDAMVAGGVNFAKLNALVAKRFDVQDDPRNYGFLDCKPYFNIPAWDAETYIRNNFDEMFAFIDADKITTADGDWVHRIEDFDYTFISRERGGVYSTTPRQSKNEVIKFLVKILSKPYRDSN